MSSIDSAHDQQRSWMPVAGLVPYLVPGALFALGIFGIAQLFAIELENDDLILFTLLAAGLSIYLGCEVVRAIRIHGRIALLLAPVLATVVHFAVAYALPAIVSLELPIFRERLAPYMGGSGYFTAINTTLALVWAGAFCMWRGYDFGRAPAETAARFLRRRRWIRQSLTPNVPNVIILAGLSIIAAILMLRLGIFGFSSDVQARADAEHYAQFLFKLFSLGPLALLLLAIKAYTELRQRRSALLVGVLTWVMFLSQVFLGFLFGFKSRVVIPVIIVLIAHYVVYLRVKWTHFVVAGIALFLAYAVVEPFRIAKGISGSSFDGTSITSIVDTILLGMELSAGMHSHQSTLEQIVARSDLLGPTAVGIYLADHIDLDESSPQFGRDLLLAPIYGMIPRAIWADKPRSETGQWFRTAVFGFRHRDTTSVAMGTTAYFYFAGGTVVVLFGFFMLGLVQRVLFDGLTQAGAGGWLVYLMTLETLVAIPSDVAAAFAGLLQTIPLAIVAQLLTLRQTSADAGRR